MEVHCGCLTSLVVEILVYLLCVVSGDLTFAHDGERHVVRACHPIFYGLLIVRLQSHEFIAWVRQNLQALILVLVIEFLVLFVVVCVTSLAGNIDEDDQSGTLHVAANNVTLSLGTQTSR